VGARSERRTRRNPDYNSAPADAKHQGPAYLDHVSWKFLEDGSVRFGAVQGDGADLIFNRPAAGRRVEVRPDLVLQEFTHTGLPNRIALNTTRFPFTDTAVQQAFIHGSDAEASVKVPTSGCSTGNPAH
jgi:peptide/nickel transport system substrate-binding protein